MAKTAVPNSKAPTDKGHHYVLVFPVGNIKEKTVVVSLLPDVQASAGSSRNVSVAFETFGPSKRYEKALSLAEPVTTTQLRKDANSKNLTVTLLKASHAVKLPSSPTAAASAAPDAPAGASPATRPLEPTSPGPPSPAVEPLPSASDEDDDEEEAEEEDGENDAAAAGGSAAKKKKKGRKKTKKKAAAAEEEPEVERADLREERAAHAEAAERAEAARAVLQHKAHDSKEARARSERAAEKVGQLEKELWKWRDELEAAKQAESECRVAVSAAEAELAACNGREARARAGLASADERAKEREAQAAEQEAEKREAERLQAEEEKRQLQEERRKRNQEEKARAAEEKKKKEAERKENAKRREQERKKEEAEEERRKLERRASAGKPSAAATKNGVEKAVPVYISDGMKKRFTEAQRLYKKDPAGATALLERAAQEPGGAPAMLYLSQLQEEHGAMAGCADALLKSLAHPEADTAFSERDRGEFAMKAIALLKEHPGMLQKCMPLINKLAPKYSILNMGRMMAGEDAPLLPKAAPLIEELEERPPAAAAAPAVASSGSPLPQPAPASPGAEWTFSVSGMEGRPSWTLELPVPSIESLAEINLDIGEQAVNLTPVGGGSALAQAAVPAGADPEQASAKWSKKRRVLTICMPHRL